MDYCFRLFEVWSRWSEGPEQFEKIIVMPAKNELTAELSTLICHSDIPRRAASRRAAAPWAGDCKQCRPLQLPTREGIINIFRPKMTLTSTSERFLCNFGISSSAETIKILITQRRKKADGANIDKSSRLDPDCASTQHRTQPGTRTADFGKIFFWLKNIIYLTRKNIWWLRKQLFYILPQVLRK